MARSDRALARDLSRRGSALLEHGQYVAAGRMLRKALGVTERAYGPTNLAMVGPLNELGMCFKYLARFADAGPGRLVVADWRQHP